MPAHRAPEAMTARQGRNAARGTAALLLAAFLADCAGPATVARRPSAPELPSAHSSVSAELTVGDGRVSSQPQAGRVDACGQIAPSPTAATTRPPWINAEGTWQAALKPVVPGVIRWPQARYTITLDGPTRTLTTLDLPVGGTTGLFPAAAGGAIGVDTTPVTPQRTTFTVPANPVPRDVPACLPSGRIGVLDNGVLLYGPLDSHGRDAEAHEVGDACGGHTDGHGVYHYHTVAACLAAAAPMPAVAPDHAALAGYAVDGFGIYVERDVHGAVLRNADLDACHGRISWVPWDGRLALMYHYDVTVEFPYTVGCLRGTGTGNAWDNHDPNT